MKNLLAPTEDFIKLERTTLKADATVGTNVAMTVTNNDGLAQYGYIVIGYEGGESAEIQQINAAVTPGESIQIATLLHAHKAGEPITLYRYNKRKFYGSTEESGSYFELTDSGSPKDIQVDDPQGTMIEYSGIGGYSYFKSTYFNSTTNDETDIADAVAVQADESGRYTSIYAIRKHAGVLGNSFYSDDRIEQKRKQAENEINSVLFNKYTIPLAEVPALISYICELLAAGYIDYEEFGGDGQGVKWLGEARGILKSIQDERQRLIGADGNELASKDRASAVQSYPDGVDNTSDEGPSRRFSMNQTF